MPANPVPAWVSSVAQTFPGAKACLVNSRSKKMAKVSWGGRIQVGKWPKGHRWGKVGKGGVCVWL